MSDIAAIADPEPEAEPTDRGLVARHPDERVNWLHSIPFLAVHATPLLIIFTGVTARAVVLAIVLFWTRMFFITAGYHRYFAHRSYKLARVPQFLMAFGATTAAQKGPLWWAGHHRDHHSFSDTDRDVHSPLKGFWWSHVGWILCDKYGEAPEHRIRDFAKYPELRFLDRFDFIGPWMLAITCFLVAGWSGLVVGFFCSTIVCWHATFTVNSLAHVFGRRRYATEDTSRNSALIAVLTMGEGWHNNHHYYQASARQGFTWWEWDPTFYVLRVLSWVGIVRDLKVPPERVFTSNRIADGAFDVGTFKAHWSRATATVLAARTDLGERVQEHGRQARDHARDVRDQAQEALVHKREAIEHGMRDRRSALEDAVEVARRGAEELSQLSRRRDREVAALEG